MLLYPTPGIYSRTWSWDEEEKEEWRYIQLGIRILLDPSHRTHTDNLLHVDPVQSCIRDGGIPDTWDTLEPVGYLVLGPGP